MKKQSLVLIVFFILIPTLILCLSTCKKKQEQPYYPVPEELKKECLFKPGSYWIYRNDSTGAIDSTYVDNEKPFIYGTIGYGNYSDEYITNKVNGNIFSSHIEGGPGKPEFIGNLQTNVYAPYVTFCCSLVAFALFKDTLDNHQGEKICWCETYGLPPVESSSYTELAKYKNFTVNNIIFDEVILTRAMYKPFSHYDQNIDTVDFFFSPRNGFAKIVMKVDTNWLCMGLGRATISWSLLRYSVRNY
jgi:hypothetical protein